MAGVSARKVRVRTIWRLTLENWYTNSYNKSLPTDVNKYQCLTNDLCKMKTKLTKGLLTTNKRWIETDQWPMTNLTRILQPIPGTRLYWPITFNGPDCSNTIDRQALFTTYWDLLFTKNNSCARLACLCYKMLVSLGMYLDGLSQIIFWFRF